MKCNCVKGITAAFLLLFLIATVSVPSPVFGEDSFIAASQPANSVHSLKQQVDANPPKTANILSGVEEKGEERDSVSFVRLFQGLGFCIAIFLAGVHVYKKYVLKDQPLQKRTMRIIERMSIAPKSSLLLIEVEKKKVLLAIGPDGTTFMSDHELLNPPEGYFNLSASEGSAAYQGIQQECKDKVN